jgi:hypothetical protein
MRKIHFTTAKFVEPTSALETVLEDSRTVLSFDGADHHFEKGEPLELAEGALL